MLSSVIEQYCVHVTRPLKRTHFPLQLFSGGEALPARYEALPARYEAFPARSDALPAQSEAHLALAIAIALSLSLSVVCSFKLRGIR